MTSPLSVFARKKREKTPLAMVALYDAPSAQIACEAGINAVLIGDSLGNTVLGYDSTIPVTMDAIAHHVGAVVRGVKASSRPDVAIIADMPFGSYTSVGKGVENAVRLMQLGAHAVKIEGTQSEWPGEYGAIFEALRLAGVPVMGHLGFTPQSALRFDHVVQGKTALEADEVLEAALTLERAGCFALVLEALAVEVAEAITGQLSISTIGIGAGKKCDGQVLVWHDLVGISAGNFKLAKAYAQTREIWARALQEYVTEVGQGDFPGEENSWKMTATEQELFAASLQARDESDEINPFLND